MRLAAVHNAAMKVKGFFKGIGSPSALALVAANTIPIFGAILFGWSIFSLMFLFWLENVIIGVLNVARFVGAAPSHGEESPVPGAGRALLLAGQLFMAGFFVVHYGGFCTGHGVFVFALFGKDAGVSVPNGPADGIRVAAKILVDHKLLIAAACIFVSHLFSLCYNYFYKGERYGADLGTIMMRPYGRIIVLHITIILGAVPVMILGSPIWALVLLVLLKTIVDLKAHLMERSKLKGKSKGKIRVPPVESVPR